MNPVFRVALTWLLGLALPLQGYAASSMLLCGTSHHGPQPEQRQPQAPAQGEAAVHHPAAPADASAAQPDADTAHAHAAGSGKTVAGQCSVCAACCNAAALVSTLVPPLVVPKATVYSVARLEPHAGFMPGGLERPPRPARA
jgi:hypothetical protein